MNRYNKSQKFVRVMCLILAGGMIASAFLSFAMFF